MRIVRLLTLLALVGVGWAALRLSDSTLPAHARATALAPPSRAADGVFSVQPGLLAPLPASLAGTQEDGGLVVDDAGRFVPTPDAIDLFDYYLAAAGEEPDATIRARIVAAIGARLAGAAAASATGLLDDYLVYRARAAELLGGELLGEDLERRLQYLRELRRSVFGAEVAHALFGAEEARWFVELERRRVHLDASLDAEERAQRLAALDEPEALRASRETARAHARLRREEERLLEQGAGPGELAQLREERFGVEAAERLAALDAERAGWQRRVEAYRRERAALLADVAPEERVLRLEELRSRHFAGSELVRVRALDRVDR